MNRDPLIGAQIDDYRLEALLGSGRMARVYRAVDRNLNRTVVIKVIAPPNPSDAEYGRRFKSEAQAIAQLEHPHIVRLYHYGQSGNLFYMAMQFIRGADLSEVLAAYRQLGGYINPTEASRIIRQTGEALDYAHSLGVIHRDIKASNILIDYQGRAVLADFGLAGLTSQGAGVDEPGSPLYLAPEQGVPNPRVVPQSDLYTLGVILYEMFTGQRPFSASNLYQLAQQHINEPPPDPHTLRPDINPHLEKVILKALAKDPGARYQSGQELSDALDDALLWVRRTPAGTAMPLVATIVADRARRIPAAPPVMDVPLEPRFSAGSQEQNLLSQEENQGQAAPARPAAPVSSVVPPSRAATLAPAWRRSFGPSALIAAVLSLLLCVGVTSWAATSFLGWQITGGEGSISRPTGTPKSAAIGQPTSTPTPVPTTGGIVPISGPGSPTTTPSQTPSDTITATTQGRRPYNLPTRSPTPREDSAMPAATASLTQTSPLPSITPLPINTMLLTPTLSHTATLTLQPTMTHSIPPPATTIPPSTATRTSAPPRPTATDVPPPTAVPPTTTEPPPASTDIPQPTPTGVPPPTAVPPTATEPPPASTDIPQPTPTPAFTDVPTEEPTAPPPVETATSAPTEKVKKTPPGQVTPKP